MDTGRRALPGARFEALIDPDGSPLDAAARSRFETVHPNAYAAGRPDCFVRLAPGIDPLFAARLIQTVPSVAVAGPLPAERIEREIAAYWLRRSDAVVDRAALWAEVARVMRPSPATCGLAVFTMRPESTLARALGAAGARVFGAERVALLSPRFGRTLFILEGVAAEAGLLRLLRRYGGDVVLTGACLLAAYADASGLAAAELGRDVPARELAQWREGIARPGALLLGEVAAAARDFHVPSAWVAAEVARRYRRSATVLPIAAASGARGADIAVTAGGLHAEACVWALEMLRSWGVAVRMVLDCPAVERAALAGLAERLGVDLGFGASPGAVSVMLAMRGDGRGAAGLVAGLGAGWCVASQGLAESIDAPPWLVVVPDQASPPLLAEAVRTAWAAAPPTGLADWAARHAPATVAGALL